LGLGIYAGLFYPVVEANPAMKFDMHRMQLVVWANNAGSQALSVGINSRYGSAADLKKAEGLKWGSTGARSSESFGAALISELLGLKDAKIVVGYVSSADVALASAKGEVDGYIMSQMSMMQFAEQGLLKWPFIILGLEREAELPDVPALAELAQLTPKQESMLRLVAGINEPGQILWFQPDVPRDRVEFVRAAVARIMAKESYLAKAKTLWIPLVGPLLGRDLDVKMERILSVATPANFEEVRRIVDKYIR
ncbi:MAG: tripartite tricarboxylate transporter substrate-binding protein, partial [Dehalococcoidia bacterium]|nr:tripartite tricarboxylate transporter substrate-binding protein [Dehalococcoidia bacterium]